jgi:hypothetical protein
VQRASDKLGVWTTIGLTAVAIIVAIYYGAVMLRYAKWTQHNDFREGCISDREHQLPLSAACLQELLRPRVSVMKRQIEAVHGALFAVYGTRFTEMRTAGSELLRTCLSFIDSQLKATYKILSGEHGMRFAEMEIVGPQLLRDGLSFVGRQIEAGQVAFSKARDMMPAEMKLAASLFFLGLAIGLRFDSLLKVKRVVLDFDTDATFDMLLRKTNSAIRAIRELKPCYIPLTVAWYSWYSALVIFRTSSFVVFVLAVVFVGPFILCIGMGLAMFDIGTPLFVPLERAIDGVRHFRRSRHIDILRH